MKTVIAHLDNALLHMKKKRCLQPKYRLFTDSGSAGSPDNDDLSYQLLSGCFCFSSARCIEYKPGKYLHSFRTFDALVLKAMALAVQQHVEQLNLSISYRKSFIGRVSSQHSIGFLGKTLLIYPSYLKMQDSE